MEDFFASNPENLAKVEQLVTILSALPIDTVTEYKDLSDAVGRDVQRKHRYLLQAAVRESEKALGCIFGCVRGVGIKRLNNDEGVEIGHTALRHVRRHSNRSADRLERVRANTEGAQKRAGIYSIMLRTISAMADSSRVRTAVKAGTVTKPIPDPSIMEALKK